MVCSFCNEIQTYLIVHACTNCETMHEISIKGAQRKAGKLFYYSQSDYGLYYNAVLGANWIEPPTSFAFIKNSYIKY